MIDHEYSNVRSHFDVEMNARAELAGVEFKSDDFYIDPPGFRRKLFQKNISGRLFLVDLVEPGELFHDAFIKKTGLNCEIDALQVMIPRSEIRFDDVWDLYLSWVVRRDPVDLVQSLASKLWG